jgi:hypothetical protein
VRGALITGTVACLACARTYTPAIALTAVRPAAMAWQVGAQLGIRLVGRPARRSRHEAPAEFQPTAPCTPGESGAPRLGLVWCTRSTLVVSVDPCPTRNGPDLRGCTLSLSALSWLRCPSSIDSSTPAPDPLQIPPCTRAGHCARLGSCAARGPKRSEHTLHDLRIFGYEGMAPTQSLDRVNVAARQATLGMVLAERRLVGCLDHAVDHPIGDPVRERLRTVLIDDAAQGLPLHLLLDHTRDGCQWMAIDVRRHETIPPALPVQARLHVIPAVNGCPPLTRGAIVTRDR